MDAKSSQAVLPSEPLMYQTWFLKVSIHCEGCRRKVKKVLQSIDGVFTTTVDLQQQKVTVTGSVGVETLIRKLEKAGKHAEIWPENVAAGKGNNSGKDKQQQQQKKKKKNEQGEESESKNNHSTTKNAVATTNTTANTSKKKVNEKSAGERGNAESKSGGGGGGGENESPEAENKGGQSEGGGKKKKKKEMEKSEGDGSPACNGGGAHSGSPGQVNLSPTRQQSYLYPETYCYPPLLYLATHNRLCPMGTMGGPSYYVSPLPYMCAGIDHDPYRLQSTPFVPFEIFSDENANGCCIM